MQLQPKERRGAHVPTRKVLIEFWRGIYPYRWSFLLIILVLIAGSVFTLITPILYKNFIDILTATSNNTQVVPTLTAIIITIFIIHIVRWAGMQVAFFTNNYFQSRVMAKLRQNSFDYLIDHSYSFFANNFTGSLTQRINRFARAFERLTDRLFWSVIPITVSVVGMSIILWKVNPLITAIIFTWVVVLMTFNYFFSRWRLKYNIQSTEADSKTTGLLSDNITNQNSVQLFTGSRYETGEFKKVTDDQARITMFTWNLGSVVDGTQAILIVIIEFLLFFYAIRYWQQGLISVGAFVLIQSYFGTLASRLWDFSRIIRDWYESMADAKEMVEIMLEPHEIKDIPGATDITVQTAHISYKHVSFSFNETREVLHDVSLDIPGGQKIALIGPSGAGKSTFVRLLLRLYETGGGSITIDNQDIHSVTQESLRKNLSLVPQDPVLFHRSLKENIRYGRQSATDEEVIKAAQLAHCHEFIESLPQGYDTLVGERGIKLSGGERQRVAIARAILKNAPILILDEATSSLDSESEHLIQDALDTLMKGPSERSGRAGKTVIVIAHRLSTIRKMDRIVVLEEGAIREEGTHDNLLKQENSLYKKLWNLQAGGFIPMQ